MGVQHHQRVSVTHVEVTPQRDSLDENLYDCSLPLQGRHFIDEGKAVGEHCCCESSAGKLIDKLWDLYQSSVSHSNVGLL